MFGNLKVAAIGALFLGLVAAAGSSIAAGNVDTHTNYITFSRSVALPGVELAGHLHLRDRPPPCRTRSFACRAGTAGRCT
jgi:hypothetical protein